MERRQVRDEVSVAGLAVAAFAVLTADSEGWQVKEKLTAKKSCSAALKPQRPPLKRRPLWFGKVGD